VISLILSAVFSSALYVFSFSPWSHFHPALSSLQWIAFVPILFVLDQKQRTTREILVTGYVTALGITIGGFYWIIYATQQYGGLPFVAALGVFAAFCLIAQLQIPIYLLLRNQALRWIKPRWWIPLSGLIYAGIESAYPKLFLDSAGHAFADSVLVSQVADVGGVFFLTALVITVAESVNYACKQNRKLLIVPMLLVALVLGYGKFRVTQIDTLLKAQKELPALHMGIIQANIGDYLKIAAEQGASNASDQVIGEYLKYSAKAVEEFTHQHGRTPDALVWPETAYSSLFGKPQRLDEHRMEERLRAFANDYPGTMIFGGYDQDHEFKDYNSIFFLTRDHSRALQPPPVYHKNVLLMFGETLPFAETFPAMKTWFPTMGFFGRGPGPEVHTVQNQSGHAFQLAPSICYEGLFPAFSATGANLGADALINVTNDSWFGPDGEPYLHFALTRFRTIETRLPMIRSTNTGISALIDPLGRINAKTDLLIPAVLPATIHPRIGLKSPYLSIADWLGGQWFERLSQVITLALAILVYRRRRTIVKQK
jgi:apolipoprotein N-acyltransferase